MGVVNKQEDLRPLLDPESIAIVGASNNDKSIGGRPIKFLKDYGYQGKIYAINPKYDMVQGVPCYPEINALPEAVDLLIVAVRAELVLTNLEQAKEKGIKSALVFSSGFGEIGGQGLEMQKQLADLAIANHIPICGPNCQGFINHWDNTTATFTGALTRGKFKKGPAALIAQSGAVGGMLYAIAQETGIGLSYMIVGGNEAVVSTGDYLYYVLNDEKTRVVATYMEGIKDAARLAECAQLSMEKEKPIIAMKVGRSAAGSKAAASHTGSIAGEDSLADAFFRQFGIIRVDNASEMFHCLKIFSSPKRLRGKRIGILSISGGAGVIMADACEKYGLELAQLQPDSEEQLRSLLPPFGSPRNPVDITAQVLTEVDKFYASAKCVVDDPGTDGIVIFIGLLEHLKDQLIPAILKLDENTDKPITVVWMAGNNEIRESFQNTSIPFYEEPTQAIYALGQLNKFRGFVASYRKTGAGAKQTAVMDTGCGDILNNLQREGNVLDEINSKKLFKAFNIPVTNDVLVKSQEEAVAAIRDIGFPVVMKIVSPDITHKSDAGGVILNITSTQELIQAYEQIMNNVRTKVPHARIDGIMISQMVPPGTEMLVGLKHDNAFGPIIVVGMGGIYVEVLKDASSRILPINRQDAYEMLEELQSYPLLKGVRGQKAKDIEALVDVLLSISNMGMALQGRIAELDINPLIVFDEGQGVCAADGLVSLR